MLAPLASTIYFPALPAISRDLNASSIAVNATVSLFILFMGIAPVFWASLSDHYGIRRVLYLVSVLIFIGATIGAAFVNSTTLLIILRCIQSCGSSSLYSLSPGTIADCFGIHERGMSMGLLFLGQYIGPLIGPTIGGFLTSRFGWRSTFYFCGAFGVFIFFIMFFALPETYRREDEWLELPSDSSNLQQKGTNTIASEAQDIHETVKIKIPNHVSRNTRTTTKRMNPFASLALLKHWFLVIVSIETGISFGTMFTIETILPELFSHVYGLSSAQTGITYLGAGCGNILGSCVGGVLSDYFMRQASKRRGGTNIPEDRLAPHMWLSGYLIVPGGALIFGWTVYYGVYIVAPIIGFGILCFGLMQISTSATTYLVDAVPGRGASASAAANFVRMTIAAILSITAEPLIQRIGVRYLSVLLAVLNLAIITAMLWVKFKGEKLRKKSGL
ncbi:MFS general substrate transporter [Basidiobolus meristosporus CBS 931.73]|uniref:MFS general substrate transporter n=1 Tax=Basidiobolus meristosporus CBS 931.73 TaxID=1314790 RepID=A0A1Y1X498_9FUNG|nr:MFS general substrate transporter [Basidiobolus meristosporus CBS 931.73]|eukprot:ORX80186.1 MFS general substrate transporter [Basidiobolus meristosporus CBS 931.73]